ncbi:MAG: lactate racemase domain-containing protein, partial [Syntrophales bacterium]|nr:lactate racemase domain-containing protein [Syntrophales bacterium]
MRVRLAYDRDGLTVDFPDDGVDVIAPRFVAGLPDEAAALRSALRAPLGARPLREVVAPGDDVVIVFPDGTRPMPSARLLPVLLAELDALPPERITLLNALGAHRANTRAELTDMLGAEIVSRYRILQHDP